LISTSAVALGAYLNAKLAIGTDLRQLRDDREWQNRLMDRIRTYGDRCTLYHMLERADPDAEALWFEGRSWTYRELKKGRPPSLMRNGY
jgi:hypothetical protein